MDQNPGHRAEDLAEVGEGYPLVHRTAAIMILSVS